MFAMCVVLLCIDFECFCSLVSFTSDIASTLLSNERISSEEGRALVLSRNKCPRISHIATHTHTERYPDCVLENLTMFFKYLISLYIVSVKMWGTSNNNEVLFAKLKSATSWIKFHNIVAERTNSSVEHTAINPSQFCDEYTEKI